MNIPEESDSESEFTFPGPTSIESICRAWTSLFINYSAVGFAVDTSGNFLILLKYIQVYGRYYEPESEIMAVLTDENFAIGSEVEPVAKRQIEFSHYCYESYDNIEILLHFLRSGEQRSIGIEITMTEENAWVCPNKLEE